MTIVAFSCKDKAADAKVGEAAEVAASEGKEFAIDPTNTKVMWKASKPTGSHNGSVSVTDGSVSVKDGMITGGKFVLDMTSISVEDLTGDDKANLEGHLKGMAEGKEDHFFNVAKYPTATFEITKVTSVENKPDATHLIYGNLTMRDQTKEVGFPVQVSMSDNAVKVMSNQFSINRTDWGVNYGSKSVYDNLKDNFINDEIELNIRLSAGM